MQKILILTDIGFSERDYNRFGIDILKTKFQVEILDFTQWLSSKYFKFYNEKTYQCEGYKKILNKDDFDKTISEGEINNAIDFLSTSIEANWIRNKLKKNKINLTKVQSGLVMGMKRTIKESIYRYILLFFSPKNLFKKINMMIKKKKLKNSLIYDYIILGGLAGLKQNSIKKSKKLIKGHSFDYNIFLNLKSKNYSLISEPYVVFLDQSLPLHPVILSRGEKPLATKEKYFPALNNFFCEFEKKTDLKVVFAAHPRSRYDLYPEHLFGRKYYKNKTAELVKNSKAVLLHQTTSISFAILYNKPTIFITSNEIMRSTSYDDFWTNSWSRELNSFIFNIDKKNHFSKISDVNELFKIDKKKYKEYKDMYIKFPGTEDKNLWDIFLDNITLNEKLT